jgi:tetratricopeptide (TPR) repeat protein
LGSNGVSCRPTIFPAANDRSDVYNFRAGLDIAIKKKFRGVTVHHRYANRALRIVIAAGLSFAFGTIGPTKAANEGSQDVPMCDPGKPPADIVAGCTTLLSTPDINISTRASALTRRGNAYIRLGKYTLAVEDFETLQKQQYSAGVAFVLGQLYLNLGREDDAIVEMSKLVDAGIANAQVFSLRGAAYQNAGKYDASIEDFNKVLLLNPKDLTALNNRAAAYSKKGDYKQATKDLDAVLALDPNLAIALASRCEMFAKGGHLEEGLPSCQKADQLAPDNSVVQMGISDAYRIAGRYDEALRYSNRAIALTPENPTFLYIRALVKAKLGQREAADADIGEAIRLKPNIAAMMEKAGIK